MKVRSGENQLATHGDDDLSKSPSAISVSATALRHRSRCCARKTCVACKIRASSRPSTVVAAAGFRAAR